MDKRVKVGIAALCSFVLADIIWLGWLATDMYKNELAGVVGGPNGVGIVRWPAALVVYIFMAIGFVLFVHPQLRKSVQIQDNLWYGAWFGALVFGTYQFANYSLFTQWSQTLVLMGVVWGMITGSIATYVVIRFGLVK